MRPDDVMVASILLTVSFSLVPNLEEGFIEKLEDRILVTLNDVFMYIWTCCSLDLFENYYGSQLNCLKNRVRTLT